MWVRFPRGAGLFSLSILCNVSLNRSLDDVQHYFFLLKKLICAAWGEIILISTVWNLIFIKELLPTYLRLVLFSLGLKNGD